MDIRFNFKSLVNIQCFSISMFKCKNKHNRHPGGQNQQIQISLPP